uniref:Uncharacterized protein n=1 Tax=Rhipicephalus zambeziensis TaxID=60191 RepID=A0A224Y6A2_9ACAR
MNKAVDSQRWCVSCLFYVGRLVCWRCYFYLRSFFSVMFKFCTNIRDIWYASQLWFTVHVCLIFGPPVVLTSECCYLGMILNLDVRSAQNIGSDNVCMVGRV